MNSHFKLLRSLLLLVFLIPAVCFAQNEETADTNDNAPENATAPGGQEVEINEDNYRQFMELRDARQRRNVLPENAFKPQTGLQKMDDLPEASQKHLRNQLREIIVQGDEWQPGDEGTVFPYVPSEAASGDPELQKKEAEAWGELVDSYHKREAEIYANASRTEAAMASMDPAGGGQGAGQQSAGEQAEQGESGMTGQTAERNRSGQDGAADSFSPGASDPDARSTAGVSQNAMEFIKQQMNQAEGANGSHSSAPVNNSGAAQAGAAGQQKAEQPVAASNSSANSQANIVPQTESEQAEGVAQNAMEFLSQSPQQAGDASGTGGDTLTANGGEGPAQSGEEGGTAQQPAPSESLASESLASESGASESGAGTASGMASQAEDASGEGVSQNAMEFLSASTNASGDGSSGDSKGEGDADDGESDQDQGQQGEGAAEQDANTVNPIVSGTSEGSNAASVNESTAGTSQNALEYLVGGNSPSGEGHGNGPGGTLSIQDLLNARGTRSPGGAGFPPADADDQDVPVEQDPDKDGGG